MKRALACILAAAALLGGGLACAAGGASGESLISLSYLNGTYVPDTVAQAGDRVNAATGETYRAALGALEQKHQETMAALGGSAGLRDGRYKQGDALALSSGSTVMLLAGRAVATYSSGAVVDVTAGTVLPSGSVLPVMHRCMAAEGNGAVLSVTSETAVLTTEGSASLSPSAATDYNALARALQQMGMFSGTGTAYGSGYDLEKVPTRIEGLIMFLRLIGEERAAQAYTGPCPFVDVPDWCRKYVGYAYSRGYAAGVGPTAGGQPAFGPERTIGAGEYVTFLLRALGYRDSGESPDFTWQNVLPRAAELGVITPGEYALLSEGRFLRAHVVYLSYFGLDAACKTGGSLLSVLSASGALDAAAVGAVRSGVTVTRLS